MVPCETRDKNDYGGFLKIEMVDVDRYLTLFPAKPVPNVLLLARLFINCTRLPDSLVLK